MRYSGRRGVQPLCETDGPRGDSVSAAWLLLAFTHEGAFVLLFAVIATLVPRGSRSTPFCRAAANMLVIAWCWPWRSKVLLPPDEYYAEIFMRAALHFFDPAIFSVEIILVLLAAVVAYGAIWALLSVWRPKGLHLRVGELLLSSLHLLAAVSTIQ